MFFNHTSVVSGNPVYQPLLEQFFRAQTPETLKFCNLFVHESRTCFIVILLMFLNIHLSIDMCLKMKYTY
jgi:hypothetical protein